VKNAFEKSSSRRRFLKSAAIVTGLGALPGLPLTRPGFAQESAKAPRDAVKYQDTPKNNQQCSECMYYIAAGDDSDQGQCKVVQGDIAAKGWCMLFVAK
jgi:hypothetical protein